MAKQLELVAEVEPDKTTLGLATDLRDSIAALETVSERVATLNAVRMIISESSPFNHEPVDKVVWVSQAHVEANDYNPNSVAPPEMKLLEHSILEDGYTQPIVGWRRADGSVEVVDGFHRNRVGRESTDVAARIQGYLPVAIVNSDRIDRGDRIAATIRHNRARGRHKVSGMSEIVLELKRRNWSDKKIGKELGMDPDEVLRLSQITGLAELFSDQEFSEAWEADTIDHDDTLEVEYESLPPPDSAEIVEGWEDRTEKRSQKRASDGRYLARLYKKVSGGGESWNWIAYTVPIEKGNAPTRQAARMEADECLKKAGL